LPINTLAFLRPVLPEQKTPPVLAPVRLLNEAFVCRKQVSGTPRYSDNSNCYRYSLISPYAWFKALCPQPNSGESTRGPPLMDPPILC